MFRVNLSKTLAMECQSCREISNRNNGVFYKSTLPPNKLWLWLFGEKQIICSIKKKKILDHQGSPSMFSHVHTNIPQTLFAPHFGISTDNSSFMVALILLSFYILSAIASCLKSNRSFIVVCALFKNLCIDTNKYHLLSLNGCNEVF